MKKRKVLITGASKGLGLAIANKLAPIYDLILHATNEASFRAKHLMVISYMLIFQIKVNWKHFAKN